MKPIGKKTNWLKLVWRNKRHKAHFRPLLRQIARAAKRSAKAVAWRKIQREIHDPC